MFLKSEEDDRRPDRKKFHFEPMKVLMGLAVGFITPEIARFLSEKVIENNTLENIAGVSSIGLAIIFGIIMLFVTLKVEMIYDDEEADADTDEKLRGEQNEVTDLLSAYHEAKEAGDAAGMKVIAERLKEYGVVIKK
ncbi:MAG: hypothetical protein ACTH14_00565 [Jeotgalicoccus sp.]